LWRTAGDGSEFNNNGVQIWNATDVVVERPGCCRSPPPPSQRSRRL
jgi:hypothetical protein